MTTKLLEKRATTNDKLSTLIHKENCNAWLLVSHLSALRTTNMKIDSEKSCLGPDPLMM